MLTLIDVFVTTTERTFFFFVSLHSSERPTARSQRCTKLIVRSNRAWSALRAILKRMQSRLMAKRDEVFENPKAPSQKKKMRRLLRFSRTFPRRFSSETPSLDPVSTEGMPLEISCVFLIFCLQGSLFRHNVVSNDWVVFSVGRQSRPNQYKREETPVQQLISHDPK